MIARSCLALLLLGIIVTLSLDQSVLLRFANLSALEYRTAASLSHAGVNYSTCALPDLDPWDPASVRFFTPNHDPLRDCKPKVAVMTSVVDGEVILDKNLIPKEERKKNFVCFYRCLHPKGDRKIAFGNWTNIEADNRPKCDVIEIKCGSDPKKWTFRYLHHQIYVEKEINERTTTSTSDSRGRSKRRIFGTTEREEGIERPDVFLMVIDSVSSSSMIRALQQTMHLLREEFDAVVFRHLNKVGKNSRPNGFAFLTGRQIYNIHKSPYSEAIDAELSFKEWCQTPLDNLSFAGFPYRNEGYKTMMAEDWAAGVFNWPSCVGFADRPVDHYMRPFQLRVGGHGWGKDSGLKSLVFRQSCKEPHMAILDYTEQFLKAYANEPKFGITWLTDVAHDGFNKLYHVDKHFYRFFYDNRERLKNSFIIIMGDHGLRFGRYRSSKFGSLEDNNPALLISVPEKLRGGRLTQILKENARQLITHYDLYATLNDIASVLPESRFTDFSPLDLNTKLDGVFHGASLLRPLPTPRHCANLRVPFEYCTCQVQRTRIYDDPAMLLAAANFVVDGLNAELEAANVSERCVPLTLRSESTLLDRITPAEDLYQIELVTEPNRGKFSVVFSASRQKNGKYEFARVSDEISRVNGYAGQSECVTNPRVRPICFCREKFAEDAKKRKTGRKG